MRDAKPSKQDCQEQDSLGLPGADLPGPEKVVLLPGPCIGPQEEFLEVRGVKCSPQGMTSVSLWDTAFHNWANDSHI